MAPKSRSKSDSLGSVMLDLKGTQLDQVEKEILKHPNVGGLIYFSRNFEDVEQIADLTRQVREVRPEILIAVDHEGGRVQRFREGFTHIPAMASLGELYEHKPEEACDSSNKLAWLLASEVQAVGIDISFAPVLDVDYGGSEIIGDRAFHSDPNVITELAWAFIQGMASAGMAATGKHFPGHGFVAEDSHIAKPVDKRSFAEIEASDLVPFAELMKAGLKAVMPAHVVYPQVDNMPAGFSEYWIKGILREYLKFDGVAFSDDLSMDGADLGIGFTQRADLALNAGCDMVLVCNNSAAAEQVVEELIAPEDWTERRIQAMRGKFKHANMQSLQSDPQWAEIVALAESLRH